MEIEVSNYAIQGDLFRNKLNSRGLKQAERERAMRMGRPQID